MKTFIARVAFVLIAAVALSFTSCKGGSETSSAASSQKKVTYKCLSSSCDATVTCNEGDPVPQHCGKPMIR